MEANSRGESGEAHRRRDAGRQREREVRGGTSWGKRKNQLCRVHNKSPTHAVTINTYTSTQKNGGGKQDLTHISAFVVMAFPAYKLIISGARYERVVYLPDSGHS